MYIYIYVCPDIVDALSHSPVPHGWNYIHLCPNFELVMVGFTMIDYFGLDKLRMFNYILIPIN